MEEPLKVEQLGERSRSSRNLTASLAIAAPLRLKMKKISKHLIKIITSGVAAADITVIRKIS